MGIDVSKKIETLLKRKLKRHKKEYGSGCTMDDLLLPILDESDIIETADLKITGLNAECGDSFEGFCPKCHEKLSVATSQYWETKCSCGYEWKLVLKIIGEK